MKKVPVTLGGRTRTLYYDVNAMIDLGEALQLNLLTPEGWREFMGEEVVRDLDGKKEFVPATPSFQKVRAIVWAGLRHEDESLTLRQVGAMLDVANLGHITEAYQEAFMTADAVPSDDKGASAASPLAESARAESAT